MARRDNFRTPPRLLRINAERRAAFSFLLQRNLRLAATWEENDDEPAEHRDLRIYAGFEQVREHLHIDDLANFATPARLFALTESATAAALSADDAAATPEAAAG